MFVLVTSLGLAFSDADIEYDCFNDLFTVTAAVVNPIYMGLR